MCNIRRKIGIHIMLLFILVFYPGHVCAIEQEEIRSFSYNDYTVTYYIDGVWDTGYNVRIKITNESNIPIDDWEAVLYSGDEITNIWNAGISYSDGGTYIIGNANWNKSILAGDSVEWGYTAKYDTIPNYIDMIEIREKVTDNVSDEHMGLILETLADAELSNNESVIVDNAYVITCSEEIKEEPQLVKGVYTLTKSGKKTFLVSVLNTDKKVFAITQKVTAAFNTYTNGVCITSHSATFTAYSDSYKLDSKKQDMKINIWDKELVGGRIRMIIKKGTKELLVFASATVSCDEKFMLNIAQIY